MAVYTMQTTKLPASICDDIDKTCRKFLWGGADRGKKVNLVSWNEICQPKGCGGLGLKKMRLMNEALLMKLVWRLVSSTNELWVQLLKAKYGDVSPQMSELPNTRKGSHLWRSLGKIWSNTLQNIGWAVGNGTVSRFWLDNWLNLEKPLGEYATRRVPPNNELEPVAAYVTPEGNWEWSKFQEYLPAEILLKIASTHPPCHNLGDDGVYWRKSPSGHFSVSSAYREIMQHTTIKNKAWKLIWSWHGPEKIRTFLWLAFRNALLTNSTRYKRRLVVEPCCELCNAKEETTNHVLRECDRALMVWYKLKVMDVVPNFFEEPFEEWFLANLTSKVVLEEVRWPILFATASWALWKSRNKEVIANEKCDDFNLVSSIRLKLERSNLRMTNS
ncbi:hypothetical protein Scep_009077 [Stephania cephalantha]|uniref:Reverse transcriptase zinc-binding domain-containing protein n=1 Tax=Stephania cephalantha TaxID=152367 RepID=A0AAP0JSZ8_9MAGN